MNSDSSQDWRDTDVGDDQGGLIKKVQVTIAGVQAGGVRLGIVPNASMGPVVLSEGSVMRAQWVPVESCFDEVRAAMRDVLERVYFAGTKISYGAIGAADQEGALQRVVGLIRARKGIVPSNPDQLSRYVKVIVSLLLARNDGGVPV